MEVFKGREDETISGIKELHETGVSLRASPDPLALLKPVL